MLWKGKEKTKIRGTRISLVITTLEQNLLKNKNLAGVEYRMKNKKLKNRYLREQELQEK